MRFGLSICLLTFASSSAIAGDGGESGVPPSVPRSPFSGGSTEIETLAGASFSIDAGQPEKPTINFALQSIRFGIMLTNPRGPGLLAGNVELLVEGFGGEVFTGPGTWLGGLGLILRYNFVHPQAVVVPYFQIGGGGAYNDISRDETQALVGSEFEFTLQSSLGLRIPLNPQCSIMVEGGLLHLSNAGRTDRNHGLNSLGGLAGMAFSF